MSDDLDRTVRAVLADIIAAAPEADEHPTMPAEAGPPQSSGRRAMVALASAAMVIVGVAGLVLLATRSGPSTPASEPVDTAVPAPVATRAGPAPESTVASAILGVPTCGADLPVEVVVPSSDGAAQNGPAVTPETVEGQFSQHWELPGGTIEIRWPADQRELYDLGRVRGDQSVFDSMTVSVPDDGSQALVKVERIDPVISQDPNAFTLTLSMTPATPDAMSSPGCETLQVRYIDTSGNQTTRGYNLASFSTEPIFGLDLNPIVVSTEAVDAAPSADDIADCGTALDSAVTSDAAPSPAEALATFLGTDAPVGLLRSGYRELRVGGDDATVIYTYENNAGAVTVITVSETNGAWAVTHLLAAGC